MPPGASRGASAGVFVKSLKPRLISSDSRDASSFGSTSGFRGNSHAAFIVTLAAISGPVMVMADAAGCSAGRAHAAADATSTIMKVRLKADPTSSVWRVMAGLTYHSTHHAETKRTADRHRSRNWYRNAQRTERHERNPAGRHEFRQARD